MINNLFLPNRNNNHTPFLLHRNAMVIYIIVILSFNTLIPNLGIGRIGADITLQDLLFSHNEERAKSGLPPLKLNTTLSTSATNKASTMLQTNCWSHYCPPDKEPWDYFKEAGYNYQHAGENLAEGFTNIDSVIDAWMNSPTHRENVLNGDFEEVGFGFAYGDYQGKSNNIIIAVHFGTKFKPKQIVQNSEPNVLQQQTEDVSVNQNTEPLVTIDSIQDGQYIDKNYVDISGKVNPPDSSVGININETEVGRVDAFGENYSYRSEPNLRDGEYFLSANIYNINGEFLAQSEVISFFVDGNDPHINRESINVNKQEEFIVIDFSTSEDVKEIKSNITYNELLFDEEFNRWFISFSEYEFNQVDSFNIELIDSVGNSSQFIINSDDISSVLSSIEFDESVEELSSDSTFFIFEYLKRIQSGGVKTLLPIIFSLYLLTLFIIDFAVLTKTNKLHMVKRNSHLNIAIILILLILFSFGSLTGSILTNGIEVSATL